MLKSIALTNVLCILLNVDIGTLHVVDNKRYFTLSDMDLVIKYLETLES